MKRPNKEFNAGERNAKRLILAFIGRHPEIDPSGAIEDFIRGMAKRAADHPGGAGTK